MAVKKYVILVNAASGIHARRPFFSSFRITPQSDQTILASSPGVLSASSSSRLKAPESVWEMPGSAKFANRIRRFEINGIQRLT